MKLFCLTALFATLTMAVGQEVVMTQTDHSTLEIEKIYACPRCRKAQPKGPAKRPHPPVKSEAMHA